MEEEVIRNVAPIGLIGNSIVGKSSLSLVYTGELFNENIIGTIGIDCMITNIKHQFKGENEPKNIKVKIWDTAGQEKFRSIGLKYIKNCYGLLVVYSIIDRQSFEEVEFWIEQIKNGYNLSEYPFMIIGNKCDLENKRVVNKEEGEKIAKKYNIHFYETSAKEGINVKECFNDLLNQVFEKYHNEFVNVEKEEVKPVVAKKKKKGCFF